MTDYQIIEAIRNNESDGLRYLFKKYYEFLVRSTFYVVCDKELAEDLVQDAFVKIWERRHQLPDIVHFKSYLYRMVRNSALDHIKSKSSADSQLEQFLYLQDQSTEPQVDKPDNPTVEISKALSQLPPKCRLIFSMNRFEGLTNDEIADYLEISKRTVETQISKALKILRKEFKTSRGQFFMGLLLF